MKYSTDSSNIFILCSLSQFEEITTIGVILLSSLALYGFSNGDEIIKFTARTIVNNIHNLGLENSFIGHIGGDDFIAILEATDYDKISRDIISDFDTYVLGYFSYFFLFSIY